MKTCVLISCVALASQSAYAFPHLSETLLQMKREAPNVRPPFDAAAQYVSTKGENAFVAPGPNDQRGPCPGLNAMANHGYIPHNGVGSIADFITGTQRAFGMGPDLATLLAIYGAIFDGDLTSYSIGGPVPSLAGGPVSGLLGLGTSGPSLLNLGGLLGQPKGLSGSHNKYEGDVSPTRGDLYQYGNDYLLQLPQFTALWQLGQKNGNKFDLNVLFEHLQNRFKESIANNPYFYHGPFTGVVVSPAAYTFIYRFMGNKSAEHPEGLLDGETLKSFFSITGDYPNFKYTPGHEKFPDNWYKRNPADPYTIPFLTLDSVKMYLKAPELLSVGGNMGTPNSFVGVNPANLTGGIFTAANLLEGNNIMCFGLQAALQAAPDILSGIFSNVTTALGKLTSAIGDVTGVLSCPKLTQMNNAQLSQFPGYSKLKPDGTY